MKSTSWFCTQVSWQLRLSHIYQSYLLQRLEQLIMKAIIGEALPGWFSPDLLNGCFCKTSSLYAYNIMQCPTLRASNIRKTGRVVHLENIIIEQLQWTCDMRSHNPICLRPQLGPLCLRQWMQGRAAKNTANNTPKPLKEHETTIRKSRNTVFIGKKCQKDAKEPLNIGLSKTPPKSEDLLNSRTDLPTA